MWNFQCFARVSGIATVALAAFLVCSPALHVAQAQDAGGSVGTADGGSDVGASGDNTSSAGTDTSGSTSADSGSASGDIDSSGNAAGDGTEANTNASSTANVEQSGEGYNATSSASGGGDTGGGGAVGAVTATAEADTTGEDPYAKASTDNGVYTTNAQATYGAAPDAIAPPGGKEIEKQNTRRSVAIAIAPDGSYSIAVAKKNSAYAKAGAKYYGKTLNSAVRAMVAAYAKATRSYGLAQASAGAWASSRSGNSYATSSSWTNAFACVGSKCTRKQRLNNRRLVQELFVRCTWLERQHVLICPKLAGFATARR